MCGLRVLVYYDEKYICTSGYATEKNEGDEYHVHSDSRIGGRIACMLIDLQHAMHTL